MTICRKYYNINWCESLLLRKEDHEFVRKLQLMCFTTLLGSIILDSIFFCFIVYI